MESDQSDEESPRKSDALRNLTANGPLSISVAKLSASSRIIPSQQAFHFYNNFPVFKAPIHETSQKAKNLQEKIGASDELFMKPIAYPDDKSAELDDEMETGYVVNTNDEIYEGVDESLDEFKALRKKEEESGGQEDGFQVVYGKRNKKLLGGLERNVEMGVKGGQEVKVAMKLKPKVPFHVPSIPKPQDEYKINVNNSNVPFKHVWLEQSEDGSRFIHHLENLSVLDFVDTSVSTAEPVKPPAIEVTPFKFVEEVKDLKQLANKLRSANEFAVDLEHNQYRSFQGMTCLMQISTRTEDFVIDTLKLRIHVGPYLREVFKDPTKRKVMHGANLDIAWLQRDFGIYVCNMFDTGQASRVLKLERFSLEYLLNHFCGVTANKEYQNADWRVRPLPREMIKRLYHLIDILSGHTRKLLSGSGPIYAREDTHYLLYMYDLMRTRLLMSSAESEDADPPLVQVYKRSYDICTQLYEKELLTDSSYLHIYGVHGAELNAQQLAIVSGLCEWRDVVARTEDESTGYILPNRTLVEIAKEMPLTASHLRRVLKSKHPFIDRNVASIVSVIRHSIQNAAAFEETAKYLKERRMEILCQTNEENTLATEESKLLPSEAPELLKTTEDGDNIQNGTLPNDLAIEKSLASHSAEATVQTTKKPSRGFGALFGNSAKRKFDPDKKEQKDTKLEQIKSSVSLPFHTFSGKEEQFQSDIEKSAKMSEDSHQADIPSPVITGSSLADIIILKDDSDIDGSAKDEIEDGDELMSLSDLSSSFQKILPSLGQSKSSKEVGKSRESEGFLQVKPFDYEAARKEIKFGGEKREGDGNIRSREKKGDKKKGSVIGESKKDEESADFAQGRRRQAFPASGNRSATFR